MLAISLFVCKGLQQSIHSAPASEARLVYVPVGFPRKGAASRFWSWFARDARLCYTSCMPDFAAPVERLIDELKHLPGIGQKTAQRLAFFLLRCPPEDALGLA